jgi:hypothetical protein
MAERSMTRLVLALLMCGASACDAPTEPLAVDGAALTPAYDPELAGPLVAGLDDAVVRLIPALGRDGEALRDHLLGLRGELERRGGQAPADAAVFAASAVMALERLIAASVAGESDIPGAELSAVLLVVLRVEDALPGLGAGGTRPATESDPNPSLTEDTHGRTL